MTNRMLSAIAVTALVTGSAFAQTSTTTTTTITTDQAAKVKTYVMKEKKPSVQFSGNIAVGTALPADVTFYQIPTDVGVTGYSYTVVNDRAVLVEPTSRKIVRIIE